MEEPKRVDAHSNGASILEREPLSFPAPPASVWNDGAIPEYGICGTNTSSVSDAVTTPSQGNPHMVFSMGNTSF